MVHPRLDFLGGVELQHTAYSIHSMHLSVHTSVACIHAGHDVARGTDDCAGATSPRQSGHRPTALAAGAPSNMRRAQLTESQPSASFSIACEALSACRRVLKSRSCTEINLTSTEQKWTSFAADGWTQDASASNIAAAEATNPGEGMVMLAAQGPGASLRRGHSLFGELGAGTQQHKK